MFTLPSRLRQADDAPLKPGCTQLILQLLQSVLIFQTPYIVAANVNFGNPEILSTLCLSAAGDWGPFLSVLCHGCGVEPRNPPRWFRAAWWARQLSLRVDSLAMRQVVWGYYLPEKENHGYGHLTSYDLWSRDMDFNKTSREEACCSPTKHGEIVIEHHKERQDQERDNKIENRGDRYNRKSEVHERTVGRTCSQNEEHQVGENNIRVDTQRWKTTKRKTQKEMERWHRGSRWQSMDENGPGSKCMARVVEAICQQWHERLRWWWWWWYR